MGTHSCPAPITLCYAGRSDPGRSRRHNEDRWLADPGLGLFVVADGMGGLAGGDRAAQLVIDSLPGLLRRYLRGIGTLSDARTPERILTAMAELSRQVHEEGKMCPRSRGMGATVVFALIWDAQAVIVHMGDSRAYLFHEETLHRLTRDHTPVQRLLDRGEITPVQAAAHPTLGQVTRYLGMKLDASPDIRLMEINPDDQLLLCSDGLTEMVSDAELAALLRQRLPPHETCACCIEAANAAGGNDNITVVAIAAAGPARADQPSRDRFTVRETQAALPDGRGSFGS